MITWVPYVWGLGAVALMYGLCLLAGKPNPLKLVEGADGALSTSKAQWFLWTLAGLFGTVAVLVHDNWTVPDFPERLLGVLTMSSATMGLAKGITASQMSAGKIDKPSVSANAPAGKAVAGSNQGGLISDDDGVPELSKIQLLAWTIVAIVAWLAKVNGIVQGTKTDAPLPDVDTALLGLSGLSQLTYLGKKLITTDTPRIISLSNYAPPPQGAPITVTGASLGAVPGQVKLTTNGVTYPVAPTSWADTSVAFTLPSQLGLTNLMRGQQISVVLTCPGRDAENALSMIVT